MILNAFAAATMLLSGISMPALHNRVEPQQVEFQMLFESGIPAETIQLLLQDYAAPHWNRTYEQCVRLYETNKLKIHEILPGIHYVLEFEGILDVILSGEDWPERHS